MPGGINLRACHARHGVHNGNCARVRGSLAEHKLSRRERGGAIAQARVVLGQQAARAAATAAAAGHRVVRVALVAIQRVGAGAKWRTVPAGMQGILAGVAAAHEREGRRRISRRMRGLPSRRHVCFVRICTWVIVHRHSRG